MRLSEAIREGSKGLRQAHGPTLVYQDGEVVGCCSMGAAVVAANRSIVPLRWTDVFRAERWPEKMDCPACETTYHGDNVCPAMVAIVICLNDSHKWTFEQVAAWVQAQEAIHGIGQDENPIQRQAETRELIEA